MYCLAFAADVQSSRRPHAAVQAWISSFSSISERRRGRRCDHVWALTCRGA